MSALPSPEPDDVMAIADAFGVNATPIVDLTDGALDAVLSTWTRDYSDSAWQHLELCDRCGSTGLVDDYTGSAISCPSCGGDS